MNDLYGQIIMDHSGENADKKHSTVADFEEFK